MKNYISKFNFKVGQIHVFPTLSHLEQMAIMLSDWRFWIWRIVVIYINLSLRPTTHIDFLLLDLYLLLGCHGRYGTKGQLCRR